MCDWRTSWPSLDKFSPSFLRVCDTGRLADLRDFLSPTFVTTCTAQCCCTSTFFWLFVCLQKLSGGRLKLEAIEKVFSWQLSFSQNIKKNVTNHMSIWFVKQKTFFERIFPSPIRFQQGCRVTPEKVGYEPGFFFSPEGRCPIGIRGDSQHFFPANPPSQNSDPPTSTESFGPKN